MGSERFDNDSGFFNAQPELTVTICSWNTRDDLRACLLSLREVQDEATIEIIVVDNNSEDGSPDMVAAEFPEVRLERMSRNLGFTGGHNHASSIRRGEHLLPLNSDTVVHPGAIRSLVDRLRSDTTIGIVAPKLINPDGSLQDSCRRFPNPMAALFRNTPLGRLFPNDRFTREYLMRDFDHGEERDVDWVSGAAFLIRGELADELGLFDPEYFMFCEDVDLCWRVHKSKMRVRYVPSAVVTHAIGRSTDKAPNRMIGRFHRSMFRFFAKNRVPEIPFPARPFALLFAAAALSLRAAIFMANNKADILRRRWRRE